MRNRLLFGLSAIATAVLLLNIYRIVLEFPDEAMQGGIYRIMFFHIPSAFNSLMCSFIAGGLGIAYLWRKNLAYDAAALAVSEVGLAFGLVTVFTGMIWARISWGIWWTWDARLTSYFLLLLLFSSYLLLRNAVDDPTQRARYAAVLSIFTAVDVPIIWYSIEWWRTQHPQPVLRGAGKIDPMFKYMIYQNWAVFAVIAIVLVALRLRQETIQQRINAARHAAHAY